jgi:hypothetical protein
MPSTGSELRSAFTLLALTLALPGSAAEGGFTGPLAPYASLTASSASAQLEAGVEVTVTSAPGSVPDQGAQDHRWDDWQVRLFGRLPTSGADSTTAQLDRSTTSWRLGVRAARRWGTLPPPSEGGRIFTFQLSALAEWGHAVFEYFPDGVETDRRREAEDSLAAELQAAGLLARHESGAQAAPQLRVRYARDWRAADQVGVVVPGSGTSPSTVKDLVIAAPGAVPELSARVAVPFTFGSEIGYGPALMYTARGAPRAWEPGSKVGRLRGEAYLYWFPSSLKGGGRIGLGAYADARVHGSDERGAREYGALLDVRLGANLLEY